MSTNNTGEVLYDLPSPYMAHKCGLLHLPRFIAKIRKFLAGELPVSYERNFTKGFDGFLCLHLGIEPQAVIEAVQNAKNEEEFEAKLEAILPEDLKIHEWNRKLVQMGMNGMGRETLEKTKSKMNIEDRLDLLSFADMIDYDEKKIK